MYKLLIVDDEKIIRRGLRSIIDWENLGFQVIGDAENGIEALDMVKEFNPHAVLTDIRMPRMDGMELLKKIKADFPAIRVVFLSGHEDFRYAKDGLSYGAEGYVLKMSLEEDVAAVFSRIKTDLDNQIQLEKKYQEAEVFQKKLFYNNFFQSLISGDITKEEVEEVEGSGIHFSLLKNDFCVVYILLEYMFPDMESKLSIQDYKNCLKEITELANLTDEHNKFVLFKSGKELVVICFSKGIGTEQVSQNIYDEWKDFQMKAGNYRSKLLADWRISVGIGGTGTGWETIRLSYIQARKAAYYQQSSGLVTVNKWIQVEKEQTYKIMSIREQNELIRSITLADKEAVDQYMNYMFKSIGIMEIPNSIEGLQLFLTELVVLISFKLKELDIYTLEMQRNQMDTLQTIQSKRSINELERWMRDWVSILMDIICESRKLPAEQAVMKVVNYIKSHYSDKILLEDMASNVFVSHVYLSTLFKKYMGKGFMDYLVDIRMEKAMEYLEKGYSVKDTAEQVGYNDIRHFTKMFKKRFGTNPSEI